MNLVVLRFEELASTNTEALEQARRGAAEGLCIVAEKQTAGRGRHGREWNSPTGTGLYLSIVLRPKIETKHLPLLTLMAAVAAHEMLTAEYGIKPDIKWANDIHVSGKKICGILAELTETTNGTAVVLGIGINLRRHGLLPAISVAATSIERETGERISGDAILPLLTKYLLNFYTVLQGANGPQRILAEWEARSTYFSGKDVRVILPGETLIGTTCGLEENGALRVKQPDGKIRVIQAGDVESLRPV